MECESLIASPRQPGQRTEHVFLSRTKFAAAQSFTTSFYDRATLSGPRSQVQISFCYLAFTCIRTS